MNISQVEHGHNEPKWPGFHIGQQKFGLLTLLDFRSFSKLWLLKCFEG